MIDYDKNKESLYLKYWDVNNLFGQAMSQKLKISLKNFNEQSDEGYFLEVDVQYPKKIHKLHNDSPFLHDGMKIEKVEKLVTNLHDKTKYTIHIKRFKASIKPGIYFEKSP